MKKSFVLALVLLMLLSLAACGEKTPASNDNNENSSTQQTTVQDTPGTSATPDNVKSEEPNQTTSGNDEKNPASMLPKNFHMVAPGLDLYKIGDDFMNSSTDFWRYIGAGQYEIYYWDNDGFIDSGCSCGMESFLEFTVDYLENQQKTSDTKEICGVSCVKYTDSSGTEYYLDEASNLIFEVWFEGATRAAYTVVEWDTTVTEFPVAAPQK